MYRIFVCSVIIFLITGCGQIVAPSTSPRLVERAETVTLPTSIPTVKPTPVSTRVLPPVSLTPTITPTITAIPDEVRALVVDVIDGNTINVVMEGDPPGRIYQVRYIGIEVPPIENPWGAAAYEANRKKVGLKVVRLVRDQSNDDDEGRLLRYVYTDDELMSIILTEQGLARAAVTEPDTRFESEILEAEARARDGKLGLWGASAPTSTATPGTPASPGPEGTVEPQTSTPAATVTETTEAEATEESPAGGVSTQESETGGGTTTATATP